MDKDRHPKVEYGHHITIRDDVMRRDLTCNALYYDIRLKKIIDLVGGLHDIQTSTIRAVGNPTQRFHEDRLRIMRVFRFSARMNMGIDVDTKHAIERDNRLNGISEEDDVSQERIIMEFLDMLHWSIKNKDMDAWLRYLNHLKEFKMFGRMFKEARITTFFYKTFEEPIIFTRLFDRNIPDEHFHNKMTYEFALPGRITDVVIFLLKLKEIFNSKNIDEVLDYQNKDFNIVTFYRQKIDFDIQNSIIEEYGRLSYIDKRYINAFINYEPTTNANELMKLGFKGRELGLEIKRIETEKFKELI